MVWMRHFCRGGLALVVPILVVGTGCQNTGAGKALSQHDHSSAAVIGKSLRGDELFVGIGPDFEFTVLPWEVAIDSVGRVSVSHIEDSTQVTLSPQQWFMALGSLAFVEDPQHLWVYSADHGIALFRRTPSHFGHYGEDNGLRETPDRFREAIRRLPSRNEI